MIQTLPLGPLQANCYIVTCDKTDQCVVFDPGDEAAKVLSAIEGRQLIAIIATHAHFDHVLAVPELKRATGVPFWLPKDEWLLYGHETHVHPTMIGLPAGEPLPEPDRYINEPDEFSIGELPFRTMSVPGHAPDHVAFVMEGDPLRVFSGDVLFRGSIGRYDIPGADREKLMQSLERMKALPDDTIVYPGHGPSTTIGDEKRDNPYL